MAQTRKASGEQRKAPFNKVHVHCKICESQIGIFKNEWIKLTSAYARPRERGTTKGVRTGETTRTVPDGVAHKMAAGCEMAELFCEGCDTVVGQYCKNAPERKRDAMAGQYFYKFSKAIIKDAKTKATIEPVFINDGAPGTPKPQPKAVAAAHVSSPASRRVVSAPAIESSPAKAVDQQDGGSSTPPRAEEAEEHNPLMDRLMALERLVRAGSFVPQAPPARPEPLATPVPVNVVPHEPYSYARPEQPPLSHQDQMIEDQKRQITSLNAQLDTLRGTIDDLRGVIQDLRAEKTRQQSLSLRESAVMNNFEEMMKSVRSNQPSNSESDDLRAENQRLKDKLSNIAGAMGNSADERPETRRPSFGYHEQDASTNLGKRKRNDAMPSRAGFRPGDHYPYPNETQYPPNGGDYYHPLTPESLQEMAAARGQTPAGRPGPSNPAYPPSNLHYVPPHLRPQYGEPNMQQPYEHGPSGPPNHPPYPPPPPSMYGNNDNRYPPPMPPPRTESRMAAPRPPMQTLPNGNSRPSSGSGGEPGSHHPIDFSDDEIATANASDTPLSIPRPRPLPPPSLPPQQQQSQYPPPPPYNYPNRPNGTFEPPPRPASAAAFQTPTPAAHAPAYASGKPKHVARSLTCHSLRQPATGYGLDMALHFTPDTVKQRIPPKRVRGRKKSALGDEGQTRSKEESDSVVGVVNGQEEARSTPAEIPIDPALESAGTEDGDNAADKTHQQQPPGRGKTRIQIDDSEDEEASDDAPFRPGRGSDSTRKSIRRATRKSVVATRDELAAADDDDDDDLMGLADGNT